MDLSAILRLFPRAFRQGSALYILLVVLGGCGGSSSGEDDESISETPLVDPSRLTPSCFQGGETPLLDLDAPVPGWTWNDPHVLKVGTEYWMYASATDNFSFPVRLYRLVSPDGLNWILDPPMPILEDAAPGAWDAGGLETPAVVFFNGMYHLFYTAYPHVIGDPEHDVANFRIGHAASSDGITFTRMLADPIVAPSGEDADPENDWHSFIVGEPGPVVFNGELYLYFTAVGVDPELGASLQVIGLVRSADGASWQAPQLALKPDQNLYPRSADWIGYSTPNAIELADGMHLFFDVAHQPEGGEWRQRRLHHARSDTGIAPWIHDATAIRSAGDFAWAVDEIRSPHALLDDATLRLYFAGHELNGSAPEHFAIGMMTCNLSRDGL